MEKNSEFKRQISEGADSNDVQRQSSEVLPSSSIWTRARVKKVLNLKGYIVGRCVGSGSYSKVYQAFYRSSQPEGMLPMQSLACKVIDRRRIPASYERLMPRETVAMLTLSHPNIVSVQSIQEYGPYMCVFMDYCRHGDLLEYVQLHKRVPETRARVFFRQLVQAVEYMHREGFCHRDIKCENILLAGPAHVKLADFSFAKRCAPPGGCGAVELSTTYCGSVAYTAPEVLQGIPYDPKAHDMWSLGCVLFIMITGTMPFDESRVREAIECQLHKRYSYPVGLKPNPSIMQLIDSLIEPDVTVRAIVEQVAKDPWLQGP
ncbi:AGAP008765-PA-like protein [Anopheles sinensis]|uniref:AGAP008765-PA-like protein n=1 Tax=Anopheles sinensis TaxID=74873 RepID=A0A084VMQ1_ANOSI|nr:AGAP008765-PA-like protein [Anopheles sinensis]